MHMPHAHAHATCTWCLYRCSAPSGCDRVSTICRHSRPMTSRRDSVRVPSGSGVCLAAPSKMSCICFAVARSNASATDSTAGGIRLPAARRLRRPSASPRQQESNIADSSWVGSRGGRYFVPTCAVTRRYAGSSRGDAPRIPVTISDELPCRLHCVPASAAFDGGDGSELFLRNSEQGGA